jgi:hypothetical protein
MSTSPDTALAAARLLAAGDYYGALRFLNSLTAHRFTALYRCEGDRAWNVVLYDKHHPYSPQFPEVGADETYCSMAMRECRVVVVHDSLADGRLSGHAAREVIRSYCGAPLIDGSGNPFGTICHFDFEPVPAADAAAELLHQVSLLIDPDAVAAALIADIARRIENLERTLPLLVAAVEPGDRWSEAFDELAEPVVRLIARAPARHADEVNARLDELRTGFEHACQARFSSAAA